MRSIKVEVSMILKKTIFKDTPMKKVKSMGLGIFGLDGHNIKKLGSVPLGCDTCQLSMLCSWPYGFRGDD